MASLRNEGSETFYLVTFRDTEKGETIHLKAKSISDSSLGLSFVQISDFIFNTQGLVINPIEEHLSKKYQHVKSLHLAIYSIISIEEVGMEHKGLNFKKDRSNLVLFPSDSGTAKL